MKYIFDHHDANPELYLSKFEKEDFLYKAQVWLEKQIYRFSDVVTATNGSYRELAASRGCLDPRDVFNVRNGPSKPFPRIQFSNTASHTWSVTWGQSAFKKVWTSFWRWRST